jgi:hypothetical protein
MPERERLDYELLDDDEPFEIDGDNRPHLYAHGLTAKVTSTMFGGAIRGSSPRPRKDRPTG